MIAQEKANAASNDTTSNDTNTVDHRRRMASPPHYCGRSPDPLTSDTAAPLAAPAPGANTTDQSRMPRPALKTEYVRKFGVQDGLDSSGEGSLAPLKAEYARAFEPQSSQQSQLHDHSRAPLREEYARAFGPGIAEHPQPDGPSANNKE